MQKAGTGEASQPSAVIVRELKRVRLALKFQLSAKPSFSAAATAGGLKCPLEVLSVRPRNHCKQIAHFAGVPPRRLHVAEREVHLVPLNPEARYRLPVTKSCFRDSSYNDTASLLSAPFNPPSTLAFQPPFHLAPPPLVNRSSLPSTPV